MTDPAEPIRPKRPERPTYLRSDLADAAFFEAHREDIARAAHEGRIVDDKPQWGTTRPQETDR